MRVILARKLFSVSVVVVEDVAAAAAAAAAPVSGVYSCVVVSDSDAAAA